MSEDPRARRAAPDEGPAAAGPTSGSTPSRAFEGTSGPGPESGADELPFPANVRHRMAADDASREPSLRRSLGLTALSTLIPGLGLLGARRPTLRALGLITGLAALVGIISLAYWASTNTTRVPYSP
ncbi:hypothetical protein [Tessaracoccus sp. G1721]